MATAESSFNKNFWLAVFSLVGTTIGAGIFSLPYAFFKAGFIVGFLELIILLAVVLLIQLIIGEIALRTSGKKRFVSYAEEYLGRKWKLFAAFSTLLGGVGVLLVYMILAGRFLASLFNYIFCNLVFGNFVKTAFIWESGTIFWSFGGLSYRGAFGI